MWHKLVRNALSNLGGTLVGLAVGFVTMRRGNHSGGELASGLASSLVGP